ncbi:hypothetical protein [Aureliella helgolandensis]|uniref:Uncharacterized protein n=1 Tax=Aureliella helgolandensis TaxID=2527968 RepID=A0A518GCA3_9BACT|nr:hypothetical protein [Aureliella helgolandensis]QDV26203.1 hypothetical protein Q31a_45750 [Aureliella helgolandensis]
MTDKPQVSRRDWFRLRVPPRPDVEASSTSPQTAIGAAAAGLQPVPEPVNHDGMDLSQLPPMREAFLSEEQVRQLFSDIETLGSDILLMQRGANAQRATASRATAAAQLRVAQDTLLSGEIRRLQVRYHWQQVDWIDTLEAGQQGVRLIRIAHARNAAKG